MEQLLQTISLFALMLPLYAQTVEQLQNTWWNVYKVAEVINGDSTVYQPRECPVSYPENVAPYLPEDLRISAYFSADSKYAAGYDPFMFAKKNPGFNPEEHHPEIRASGTWEIAGDGNLKIALDPKSVKKDYDQNFSGNLRLVELSDSSAYFVKEIARNGAWVRHYYFVKR